MYAYKKKESLFTAGQLSTHKIETAHLKSVELVLLPASTTSSVQPLDQGIIRNFKHYYRRRMLQKVLLTIDADENATTTNVASAISVLDAANFMSVAWQDVLYLRRQFEIVFFRGLTPDVSDESFLGFSPKETPVTLMQEAYTEFIGMHDNLQITGKQTDEELCNEVAQSGDADVEEINDTCPPSNKKVLNAPGILHRQLMYQGSDMNRFFVLEREMMENKAKSFTQLTLKNFFKTTENAFTEVCVGLLQRSVLLRQNFVKEMRPRFQRQAEKM